MNTDLLLAFSVIMIGIILISINFDSINNYYTYVIPIKNAINVDPEFLGDIHYEKASKGIKYYASIKNITLLDDNSIDIDFGNTDFQWSTGYDPIPDFSYSQNIKVNQTFAVICHDPTDPLFRVLFKNSTIKPKYTLELLKYLGLVDVSGKTMYKFYHVQRTLQTYMPCNYPKVIKYSVDAIELELPEQFGKNYDKKISMRYAENIEAQNSMSSGN